VVRRVGRGFIFPPIARGKTCSGAGGTIGRQVGETGNSHAVWEPSINGRRDEVGREEGERDFMLILHLVQPSRLACPWTAAAHRAKRVEAGLGARGTPS
jgi:hypothetical protein